MGTESDIGLPENDVFDVPLQGNRDPDALVDFSRVQRDATVSYRANVYWYFMMFLYESLKCMVQWSMNRGQGVPATPLFLVGGNAPTNISMYF